MGLLTREKIILLVSGSSNGLPYSLRFLRPPAAGNHMPCFPLPAVPSAARLSVFMPSGAQSHSMAKRVQPIPEDLRAQKEAIPQDLDKLSAQRKQQLEVLERETDKTDRTGWWKRTDGSAHLSRKVRHFHGRTDFENSTLTCRALRLIGNRRGQRSSH